MIPRPPTAEFPSGLLEIEDDIDPAGEFHGGERSWAPALRREPPKAERTFPPFDPNPATPPRPEAPARPQVRPPVAPPRPQAPVVQRPVQPPRRPVSPVLAVSARWCPVPFSRTRPDRPAPPPPVAPRPGSYESVLTKVRHGLGIDERRSRRDSATLADAERIARGIKEAQDDAFNRRVLDAMRKGKDDVKEGLDEFVEIEVRGLPTATKAEMIQEFLVRRPTPFTPEQLAAAFKEEHEAKATLRGARTALRVQARLSLVLGGLSAFLALGLVAVWLLR